MKSLQVYHCILVLVLPIMAPHGSKDPVMSDLLAGTDLQDLDPKAPLSPENLLKLLSNQSRIISEQTVRNERDHTREHINYLIKGVITSFAAKIDNLIASINHENLDLVQKIDDLELKLNTVTQYLEDVVYTDRHNCIERHSKVATDVKNLEQACSPAKTCVHSPLTSPCNVCGKSFNSNDDLETHQASCISPTQSMYPPCLLPTPGVFWYGAYQQPQHSSLCYSSTPPACYTCNFCDLTFGMESLLAQHIASRHTPETVHICDNCDFNSHSTTELLHHEANFHGNRDSLTINTAEPDILENQCSMYDDTLEANNEMVEENDEMIVDNDEMMIPQVDGNDSLCTSDGFLTPNPDIASTNRPSYNNTPGHMQLLYTLNPENQSKRLI